MRNLKLVIILFLINLLRVYGQEIKTYDFLALFESSLSENKESYYFEFNKNIKTGDTLNALKVIESDLSSIDIVKRTNAEFLYYHFDGVKNLKNTLEALDSKGFAFYVISNLIENDYYIPDEILTNVQINGCFEDNYLKQQFYAVYANSLIQTGRNSLVDINLVEDLIVDKELKLRLLIPLLEPDEIKRIPFDSLCTVYERSLTTTPFSKLAFFRLNSLNNILGKNQEIRRTIETALKRSDLDEDFRRGAEIGLYKLNQVILSENDFTHYMDSILNYHYNENAFNYFITYLGKVKNDNLEVIKRIELGIKKDPTESKFLLLNLFKVSERINYFSSKDSILNIFHNTYDESMYDSYFGICESLLSKQDMRAICENGLEKFPNCISLLQYKANDLKDTKGYFSSEYINALEDVIKHDPTNNDLFILYLYALENSNQDLFLEKHPKFQRHSNKFGTSIYVELIKDFVRLNDKKKLFDLFIHHYDEIFSDKSSTYFFQYFSGFLLEKGMYDEFKVYYNRQHKMFASNKIDDKGSFRKYNLIYSILTENEIEVKKILNEAREDSIDLLSSINLVIGKTDQKGSCSMDLSVEGEINISLTIPLEFYNKCLTKEDLSPR